MSLKISDFFFILKSDSWISKYCSNNLFLQPKLLFTTTIYATVFTFSCDFWNYIFFFYWVPGLTAMFSTPPLNISLFKSHFPRGFSRGTSESTNCCQISSWLCTIFINCCWTLLNLFHFMKLFIMQIRWNLISDSRM